jgi:hypothetical protein
MKTLQTLGVAFNKRHSWIFTTAKRKGVALCGGCAAAVSLGNADYAPKDIDFVATKDSALEFLDAINGLLIGKSVHYRVYANVGNSFVPSTALAHYRITSPFWLPICLFVLSDETFRAYRIKGGHMLQIYSDIKAAAEELTEIDNKPRLATTDLPDHLDPFPPIDLEHEHSATAARVGSGTKHE